jgi:UMF1 family MFS transporter
MPAPSARGQEFAWCMYDWANSAYVTTVATAVLPAYFAAAVVPAGGVSVFGVAFTAPALWGYLMSAIALAVFLLAPPLGAVADHTASKKPLLAACALGGAAAAALLWFSGPGRVGFTMLLFGLAHTAFLAGNVFYDAFLPHVAPAHRLDRVSGKGYAYGYLGGGLQFALALGLVAGHARLGLAEGAAARLAMVSAALWWGGFTLVTLRGLHEPAAPPLPGAPRGLALVGACARLGFAQVAATGRRVRENRRLLLFLAAFLFYNDGIQTTIAMATIYGKAELHLATPTLMLTLLLIQFVAIPGSLAFGRLAEAASAKTALAVSLAGWTAIVVAAAFMSTATHYLLLGVAVGCVLGGSQALSRSLYARLIPQSAPAEFFGYFSVVNKLSAVVGPFLFALITQLTGSSRLAIPALALFFAAGGLLLSRVPIPPDARE